MDEFNINTDTILEAAEAETLSGDIRDALLTHVRSIKVPWTMLGEDEQQMTIDAIAHSAERAVRIIASLIASSNMPHVIGTVGKFVVKNDLKVEFVAASLPTNILALAEHGKASAVLVLANPAAFIDERAPAKADKDQPDLPLNKAA